MRCFVPRGKDTSNLCCLSPYADCCDVRGRASGVIWLPVLGTAYTSQAFPFIGISLFDTDQTIILIQSAAQAPSTNRSDPPLPCDTDISVW
jgi:hypothetical protein